MTVRRWSLQGQNAGTASQAGRCAARPGRGRRDGRQDARRQLGHSPAVPACARRHHLGGRPAHPGGPVPVLRRFGAEVPRAAARRFNQVAWTAFAVLVVTGVWNIVAVQDEISDDASYRVTLIVKLIVVGVSGVTAALHARARSPMGLAVFGALTGASALAALFLGVLLAG